MRRYSEVVEGGLDDLAHVARAELKRRSRERRAFALLRRGTASPLIAVTERLNLLLKHCSRRSRCNWKGVTVSEPNPVLQHA